MKIYFQGATVGVTRSAYHVVTKHASVLFDCGMFQGGKQEAAKNRRHTKLEGGKLDAVLLTHGHLDHVGRLPLLTKAGYEGPIYSTGATIDLAYDQRIEVAPGIQARFVDAGHVFGSASIELTVEENGREKVVVFSGDLGPRGAPLPTP
jgi:metallo-beta-lactamase family protein